MASDPTVTTHSATLTSATVISLDCQSLSASEKFYSALLGFEVFATERAGLKLECRLLRSTECPGVVLRLRAAFGKRVGGSQPGGLLRLSFHTPDLNERLDRIRQLGALLIEPTMDGGAAVSACLRDPDGYIVELYTKLAEVHIVV